VLVKSSRKFQAKHFPIGDKNLKMLYEIELKIKNEY
jgi:hypothetical protein